MNDRMVRLYDYWRSSASYRVRIALNLAGISYEATPVNLVEGAQREPQNLALNPQGLVPALKIDGKMRTQSLAIIEYLDESRDVNFLPKAPDDRAQVRAMSYAIAMEIHPVCNLRVAKFAITESEDLITMENWMRHFISEGLADFEQMLGDSRLYCFGDRITMADICLVPQVYNANRWNAGLAAMPNIRRIMSNLDQIDAIKAAHPDLTPH